MNPVLRGVLLVLIALAAAAGGFWAYRWHLQNDEPQLPPLSSSTSAVSRPLPEVVLPDLEGRPHALSEWKGRPLLINFWASWCGPCREEIPLLKKLRREHAAQGLEVIGIAIDFRDAAASYAREAGIDYPILIAEQDATVPQAFGAGGGLPTTVFASRDGRVVAVKIGQLHDEPAEELVERTLKVR
jgi:thiol-disulfide isomerase/thioredoxin